MRCDEFRELLDEYIDNELDEIKKKQMDLHILSCEECRKEYEFTLEILELAREEVELPENYHSALCEKFESIELKPNNELKSKDELSDKRMKSNKKNKWMRKLVPLSSVAAALVLVAISYPMMNRNNIDRDTMYEMASEEMPEAYEQKARGFDVGNAEQLKMANTSESAKYGADFGATEASLNSMEVQTGIRTKSVQREKKIIKSGSINIKLESYDEKMNIIEDYLNENGAYIENKETYTNGKLKSSEITIRVPKEHFDGCVEFIKTLGKVVYEETDARDITKEYYDTTLRLNNMRAQNNRYKELLQRAETVEDLLKIEAEMSSLAIDIEHLEGTLKNWDDKVQYSRLDVSIEEVSSLEPQIEKRDENLGKRIKDGFILEMNKLFKNIENVIVFLTSNAIYIILGIGLFGSVYLFIKNKVLKIKRRKKDEKDS
jgi:hypothetical protein